MKKILGIDLSDVTVVTACFNGVNDGNYPPYEDTDLYIKLSNDIKIFVYAEKHEHLVGIKENEYVIFLLTDDIINDNRRNVNHHIYIEQVQGVTML